MDRREFLKTTSALGACITLPTVVLAEESSSVLLPAGIALDTAQAHPVNIFGAAPRIGIIAIGGAGGATLTSLSGKLPYLTRSIAVNLDPAGLQQVLADQKILVGDGVNSTHQHKEARSLALAFRPQLIEASTDLDMVFILTGMGGTAGTSMAPVVARILREQGIITLGAAFTPFGFEGHRRQQVAQAGLWALSRHTSAVFPISNETLARSFGEDASLPVNLSQASDVFEQLYRGLILPTSDSSNLVTVGLDDVVKMVSYEGCTAFGYGIGHGTDRAEQAARSAIQFPLLGKEKLKSAAGILVTIEANLDSLKMREISKIMNTVRGQAGAEASIIFGAVTDKQLVDGIRTTVIVSGIPKNFAEDSAFL